MKGKYYVRVWLKNVGGYKNFNNLSLGSAQIKLTEQRRKGRKPKIFKHLK